MGTFISLRNAIATLAALVFLAGVAVRAFGRGSELGAIGDVIAVAGAAGLGVALWLVPEKRRRRAEREAARAAADADDAAGVGAADDADH
jgi:hypothetical protein